MSSFAAAGVLSSMAFPWPVSNDTSEPENFATAIAVLLSENLKT